MSGDRVAQAARAAVGARFRLHGRDVAEGLDCVGLVGHALAAGGWAGEVPTGYALRGRGAAAIAALLDARLARGDGERPGDVLLLGVGPAQCHLAIRIAHGLVHADAGLRRVVERPGTIGWPLLGAWRMTDEQGRQ